jgi:hypothetical protein
MLQHRGKPLKVIVNRRRQDVTRGTTDADDVHKERPQTKIMRSSPTD